MSRPCIPKTTADAISQQTHAARKRVVAKELASSDPIGARWALLEAADMEQQAASFLEIPHDLVEIGSGSEMVPSGDIAEENPDLDTVLAGHGDSAG